MMKVNQLIVLLLVFLSIANVGAMKDPSLVYCEGLGYEYKIVSTPAGDLGRCVFTDGVEVDSWKFFEGSEGKEHSYCRVNGYGLKVIRSDICPYSSECSVCVLEDGTEKVAFELMDLDVSETFCGDGVCGIPENYASCSEDCPSGGIDAYCDLVEDGICDIDCEVGGDIDCKKSSSHYLIIGGILVLIVLIIILIKALKGKSKNNQAVVSRQTLK